MKNSKFLILIIFLSSFCVFAQEKYIQHRVSKGETVGKIAQQYNLNPAAIYELNPDAVNGVKWKAVLLIPTPIKKKKVVSNNAIASDITQKTHEVLPKETIYGIAKQHNLTINDLFKINPNLEKEGLKIGQTITIPLAVVRDFTEGKAAAKINDVGKPNVFIENRSQDKINDASKSDKKKDLLTEGIEYVVLSKESLYSIAKKYGVKFADLQNANPGLALKSLKAGQKIIIPVEANSKATVEAEKMSILDDYPQQEVKQNILLQGQVALNNKLKTDKTARVSSQTVADAQEASEVIEHQVLLGESLYLIAKKYNISISDLRKSNAELGNKLLKVGQIIFVPIKADFTSNVFLKKASSEKVEQNDNKLPDNRDNGANNNKEQIDITHKVLAKETLYGIAKKYSITVASLEKQNPNISKKLVVGTELIIRRTKSLATENASENTVENKETVIKDIVEVQDNNIDVSADIVHQLIVKASENIGIRYRAGGITKEGFDCSGLMFYTFNTCNIKLPRSSFEMAGYGTRINAQDARKGDLIFFKTRGSGHINHVGMVVEVLEGELKFIHSATRGGVIISSSKESYYERNFVQLNRVL